MVRNYDYCEWGGVHDESCFYFSFKFNRLVDSLQIVNMNLIIKSVASFKFCFQIVSLI